MLQAEQLWRDFVCHAKAKCSAIAFSNWIAPIKCLGVSHDAVELEVPNLYVQEYLLSNFRDELSKHLNAMDVRFKIGAGLVPKQPAPKKEVPLKKSCNLKLNPLYTFDQFIEGPENAFVKSCAMGIARGMSAPSNPLFIYGNPGLGKTHLLHSIAKELKSHSPKKKIQCISTEAFINELVSNLKGKTVDRMKREYRSLDVLLVDDLQFLQNRLSFEEELIHTFEALCNAGKQVVVTSDKAPSQLKLSARIIGRMEGGLVTGLNIPGLETRAAILQHKAKQKSITLSYEVALLLAENLTENVRQLEGAINRLSAFSQMSEDPLTPSLVKSLMGDLFQVAPKRRATIDSVMQETARACNVTIQEMRSSSKKRLISFARSIGMYLAKELSDEPVTLIAAAFGGRTHSTLIHAHAKIAEGIKTDCALRMKVRSIQAAIAELSN